MKLTIQMIKLWSMPILTALLLLFVVKGVVASYVEEQLALGGEVDLDQVEVKAADDGHDREIYYNDGSQDIRITDNEYDDLLPVYSNGLIAWQGLVDNKGWQVFVYDIATQVTRQLTFGRYPSEYVHAAGDGIVWEMPKAVGSDIFYYDGLEVIRLTNDDQIDELPKTDGHFVVWQHYDGEDVEIMSYDLSSGTLTQLTDDSVDQTQLDIYNQEVFFKQFDDHDNEIYGLKITSKLLRQITNNDVDDANLEIKRGKLTWLSERAEKSAGASQPAATNPTESGEPTPGLDYIKEELDLEATGSADVEEVIEATDSAEPS